MLQTLGSNNLVTNVRACHFGCARKAVVGKTFIRTRSLIGQHTPCWPAAETWRASRHQRRVFVHSMVMRNNLNSAVVSARETVMWLTISRLVSRILYRITSNFQSKTKLASYSYLLTYEEIITLSVITKYEKCKAIDLITTNRLVRYIVNRNHNLLIRNKKRDIRLTSISWNFIYLYNYKLWIWFYFLFLFFFIPIYTWYRLSKSKFSCAS
jgi:hypothetical protein